MIKHVFSLLVGFGLLLVVTVSQAVPFNSFDPKSMAMGGAGVAVASPGSAPFFNPALMSIANESDDFAIELPILGGRLSDSDDFIDAADNFDDTLADDVDAAINNYNGNPGTSGPVVNAINNLSAEMLTLSDKPVEFDLNAGMVVAVPSENFGIAFSAAATGNFAGVFRYKDDPTVTSLTTDLSNLDACYALPTPAQQNNCIQNSTFTFVENGLIKFTAQSDGGAQSDILSSARFVGISMVEVGLTISREFYVSGDAWAVGVTPKSVSVTVFDYEANADSVDSDDLDSDNYSTDYSDFNIDIGIARDFDNGWRAGFVIKNLISQDYKAFALDSGTGLRTATGTVVSLKPQARIGVSHANSWSTVTADLDITENESLGGLNENSQYLALGVELNAFDAGQLRFGYRADLVDSDRSIVTAGFGISPFGVHFDLAIAGNSNEVGGALQFGFRF